MWFGLVSLFPELIEAVMAHGVVSRAAANGLLAVDSFNPRDHAKDRHRTVDDRPYGGGPGMLLKAEPLLGSINDARRAAPASSSPPAPAATSTPVVLLSAQGQPFTQAVAREFSQLPALILVAGRYEGVDERILPEIDLEISVGDFVVSGGELPALLLIDAVARCLPGVLGNSESNQMESHLDGLLDYPQYTRPENHLGARVPEVMLSGDHQAIARWRKQRALLRTFDRRPDLLAHRPLSTLERSLLAELKDWRDLQDPGAQ